VVSRPLSQGNDISTLVNGDQAYPAMLNAIAQAERSISLLTYIFDTDAWGMQFIEALVTAKRRGVEVRVLVDALGVRYSSPCADTVLRGRGVAALRFLPLHKTLHFNLRNHRKLLIADGSLAFTGGINIRAACVLRDEPAEPVRDLHFSLRGPVVEQLAEVFEEDWLFAGGRPVKKIEASIAEDEDFGVAAARAISDGPDEDLDRIPWTLHGALACAKRRVVIMTPYFLPNPALAKALNVAAMRGVQVDIVVPRRSNLPLVDWAMWAGLWRFMNHGCRIWLGPEPFDHTKLMVVDAEWVLIGSANWDPRSLRLNFELGVEVYEPALAAELEAHVDVQIAGAERVEPGLIAERSKLRRLRDGVARLLTPYL